MALDDTFQNLSSFLNSLDAEGEQKFELSHSLVIICPDCGKNIAFRGRCPKCGGNSWIPAGHAGGIFERMKAQRWKSMIDVDDDTGAFQSEEDGMAAAPAEAPLSDAPPVRYAAADEMSAGLAAADADSFDSGRQGLVDSGVPAPRPTRRRRPPKA